MLEEWKRPDEIPESNTPVLVLNLPSYNCGHNMDMCTYGRDPDDEDREDMVFVLMDNVGGVVEKERVIAWKYFVAPSWYKDVIEVSTRPSALT